MKTLLSFKNNTLLLALLVLSMLFTASCGEDDEPTGPDLVEEEYALLSTFLNQTLTGDKVVVDQQTSHPLAFFWISEGDLAANVAFLQGYVPDADQTMIEQLVGMTQDTTLHERSFDVPDKELIVMTPFVRERIFRADRSLADSWEEFKGEFGEDQTLLIMSRAAFNEDRTQALFAVIDYYITPNGFAVATGSLVLFRRQSDSDLWSANPDFVAVWVLN